MPLIKQIEIKDVISRLPDLEPLGDQLKQLSGRCVLIGAAGFESRSRAVIELHPELPCERAIIISYPTNDADNQPAAKAFAGLKSNTEVTLIPYSRSEFYRDFSLGMEEFADCDDLTLVVDLSGMASYVIYPALYCIFETCPHAKLVAIYFEAGDYFPTESEWTKFRESVGDLSNALELAARFQEVSFQAKGVEAVYGSPLFPGRNEGPLATQLVAVPSFSLERMKAMLAHAEEQYNASIERTRWIFGSPPNRQKNGWRLQALMDLFYTSESGPTDLSMSTRKYSDMLVALHEMWEEVSQERHLVIASVGSKMQHLGTFLFLSIHPEVGLILSEPQEFVAKRFSEGVGPGWWIDFGAVSDLKTNLRSCGQLEFCW